MKKHILTVLSLIALSAFAQSASAACSKVDGGNKTPFDGSSLSGYEVEKASLVDLNKAFPALNILEKTFKGEVKTCTTCSDKYVTCK